ncbi:hypothetical protein [uncultured Thermanaerothrix sp.]|uniref:hypothetical protein n=1 Tax=uncultured Thermanaerothrix sp. TaxID=1195149 RepID=UPI0026248C6E|nr:hypothetical protein [uncultured Thermanaerothrix sp.]
MNDQTFGMTGQKLTMDRTLFQAYRESPWRIQVKRIGLGLAIFALIALVAGIYLSISAQATEVGYQITYLEATREAQTLEIASLRSELASLTSASVMAQRARDLGFQPADMSQALYVPVESSMVRREAQLAPPPTSKPEPLIKPAYKQSLWDWILEEILQLRINVREAQP